MIKFAIIGCGKIGEKRAHAIQSLTSEATLIACTDRDFSRAQKMAQDFHCTAYTDHQTLLADKQPDAVIIATTHDALVPIAMDVSHYAIKGLFLEKPGAKNPTELSCLLSMLEKKSIYTQVGFNHRYHPAILEAKKRADENQIGELLYIRSRYGHGGRMGYEQEWRMNPAISGGGELIDQGIHLIDLSRWFLGDFTKITGKLHTYFWNTSVEDNAFLLLETADKKTAFLHASCTEWKNTFSFEIFGKTGKLQVDGLGQSYGEERLTQYKMAKTMGIPTTEIHTFPEQDVSWKNELLDFIKGIQNKKNALAHLKNAEMTLSIIDSIYASQERT